MGRSITITLPEGTEEYAGDIWSFVNRMLVKLQANTHKGHWNKVDVLTALKGLEGEVRELEDAIYNEDADSVHREAADVANFAMILSSVLDRKLKENLFSEGAQLNLFESTPTLQWIDRVRHDLKYKYDDPHLREFESVVSDTQLYNLKRMLESVS